MSTVSLAPARPGLRVRRAVVAGAAVTAAALLIGFVASNVYASLAQRSLRERWHAVLAQPASRPALQPGEPVARLRIPAAGIDAIVIEGPGAGRAAPVHTAGTALPGRAGLSVISSGRLGFGSFFARLDRLSPSDEIGVQGHDGVVRYRVIDVRVLPEEAIDMSSGGDAAILMLMAPASRFGGGERIVVRAKAVTG